MLLYRVTRYRGYGLTGVKSFPPEELCEPGALPPDALPPELAADVTPKPVVVEIGSTQPFFRVGEKVRVEFLIRAKDEQLTLLSLQLLPEPWKERR